MPGIISIADDDFHFACELLKRMSVEFELEFTDEQIAIAKRYGLSPPSKYIRKEEVESVTVKKPYVRKRKR